MDDKIKKWLKRIACVQILDDDREYPFDFLQEKDSYSKSFNINIGEVDIDDISNAEINSVRYNLSNITNDKEVSGCGSFTLQNGDYFKGEVFGSLLCRQGIFVRLSKGGSTVHGTWRNGLAEVSCFRNTVLHKTVNFQTQNIKM